MTTIKITAEYHDLHCISLVQITHVKKAKFVCSLLRSVRYGQVAQPCILHCGTETGFQSSSSGNDHSTTVLVAGFTRGSFQTVMFVQIN